MNDTVTSRHSMDDVVFAGRNQSYGAFVLRRVYQRHMTRATVLGIALFVLVVSIPMISRMINKMMPEQKEDLVMKEVILAEPPPIDPNKKPPEPPPKVDPPPVKDQIKFLPPIVKKDEEVQEEEPPPPTQEEMEDKVIATETREGDEDGIDQSLLEPEVIEAPPAEAQEPPPPQQPFTVVEQMPQYPDGEEAMLKYIYSNVKYPAMARENGVEGKVVVRFTVSETGELKDIHVLRGIGAGCDEEALRVISKMPKWKPGKQNGRPVPVYFTLPIKFTLI